METVKLIGTVVGIGPCVATGPFVGTGLVVSPTYVISLMFHTLDEVINLLNCPGVDNIGYDVSGYGV